MVYTISGGNMGSEGKGREGAWKGIVFSFIASWPFFTNGLQTIELSASIHSGHFMTSEDVPWNSIALLAASVVSAPVFCYVIDRHGRKVGLFMVSLAQGASCIPLYLARDMPTVLAFHIVAGVSTGGLFTVLPIYIREINTLTTKGFSLCLIMVMTTMGYLMKIAMNVEALMYLMAAMIMAQLLSMLAMMESPSYLVMRSKFGEAKKVIANLKCLEENNQNVINELQNLKDESDRVKCEGEVSLIRILRHAIYRDATKIGIILHTIMVLCGSIIFLDEEKTLSQLKMATDPGRTLVLSCLCAGSVFTVLLIRFIDKKYILTFGFVLMVLSMGLLAVFTQMDLSVTSERWVPVASLAVLVFGYGVSWGLPYVIMVEILNFEIRAKLISLIFVFSHIIRLIHVHTFRYIEELMGIYTVFYIFTFINLYGGVYSLFSVPDIQDKTPRQIEKQLKRIPLLKFNTKSLHEQNRK